MTNLIHPTAIVSPNAKLGKNVTIGQFTTIYDNVILGFLAVSSGKGWLDGWRMIAGDDT
jgi:acyl-[acyl carrier protein]--UDP-N-acetylglucosamine O-acyltransferase